MISDYSGKRQEKISAEQLRNELFAMLRICFNAKTRREGDKIRIVLSDGSDFSLSVYED